MTGRILRIVEGKHYGFINCNNKDYFFHVDDFLGNWTELKIDIKLGKQVLVNFEVAESNKGPRARDVRLINGDE